MRFSKFFKTHLVRSDDEVESKTAAHSVDHCLAKNVSDAPAVWREEIHVDVRVSPKQVRCEFVLHLVDLCVLNKKN